MKVKTIFWGRFKNLFGADKKEVELESGASLRDLTQALSRTKECYQTIFDESGRRRPGVEIMRKGREVQLVNNERYKLHDGDIVEIYPLISV